MCPMLLKAQTDFDSLISSLLLKITCQAHGMKASRPSITSVCYSSRWDMALMKGRTRCQKFSFPLIIKRTSKKKQTTKGCFPSSWKPSVEVMPPLAWILINYRVWICWGFSFGSLRNGRVFVAPAVNANGCEKVTWGKGCQTEKAEKCDFPWPAACARKG